MPMPLIEYQCKKCGKSKDELVKFPIPTEIPCVEPGCDGIAYKQFASHSRTRISWAQKSGTPNRPKG